MLNTNDIYKKADEEFIETEKSSELIFDGKVLHLYRDEIYLPNGKESFREYCRHIGAVCVVPVTDEGEIICVRQYRYAVGRTVLEIPAGKLDSRDEIPIDAAVRELREETGAAAQKITYMGEYFSSPAILDERIYMFLAEGLEFGETDFDEDEFIEIVKIPVDELVGMIMRGEIIDGKTQAAVMRAALAINKELQYTAQAERN
ncbi:MAG: NUDIX hydrolase [Ruminococcaceae bacterium]|nr:NUDIX hydrolase [Oscillospiraceae bacterium]